MTSVTSCTTRRADSGFNCLIQWFTREKAQAWLWFLRKRWWFVRVGSGSDHHQQRGLAHEGAAHKNDVDGKTCASLGLALAPVLTQSARCTAANGCESLAAFFCLCLTTLTLALALSLMHCVPTTPPLCSVQYSFGFEKSELEFQQLGAPIPGACTLVCLLLSPSLALAFKKLFLARCLPEPRAWALRWPPRRPPG